jgi:hypothetical protein
VIRAESAFSEIGPTSRAEKGRFRASKAREWIAAVLDGNLLGVEEIAAALIRHKVAMFVRRRLRPGELAANVQHDSHAHQAFQSAAAVLCSGYCIEKKRRHSSVGERLGLLRSSISEGTCVTSSAGF